MVNPRALEEAAALDRERATSGARGPLHGIPIVLKDNYDTADMPTACGSPITTWLNAAWPATRAARAANRRRWSPARRCSP